jgi:hypothetical protein
MPVDSRSPALARYSKRHARLVAVTSVGATGTYTVSDTAWLDGIATLDIVVFSGLTGGSGINAGVPYRVIRTSDTIGTATFQIANLDGAPTPLTGGSNITAGSVQAGSDPQGDCAHAEHSPKGRVSPYNSNGTVKSGGSGQP